MFERFSRILGRDPIFDKARLLLKEGKVIEAMDELTQTSKEHSDRLSLNSPSFEPKLHREFMGILKRIQDIMKRFAKQEEAEEQEWTRYSKGMRLITEDFYKIPGGPPIWVTFVRKNKRMCDLLNAISKLSATPYASDLEDFILVLDGEFLDTDKATNLLKNIKMSLLLKEFAKRKNLAALLNEESNVMLLRTRSLASLIADKEIGGFGLSAESLMPDYVQLTTVFSKHGLVVERTAHFDL